MLKYSKFKEIKGKYDKNKKLKIDEELNQIGQVLVSVKSE